MPNLDLDELDRLWGGKRIRDIVRRVGNAESGLDAALDVIDTLIDRVREQQETIAHLQHELITAGINWGTLLADYELAEEERKQLRKAAELQVLNFERQRVSGKFLGDDDHEAWVALTDALGERGA